MENITVGLAFIAGLLSFLSPCVLPLVPAYIGYMGGRMTHTVAMQTADAKTKTAAGAKAFARANMLLHSLVFVSGFTVVFVILGIVTTAVLASVAKDVIARVGGVLIIFFGLHIMGVITNTSRRLRKMPALINNPLFSVAVAAAVAALIVWGFIELFLILPILAAFLLALFLGGAFTQPGIFWGRVLNKLETMLYTDTRADFTGREGLGGSFMMGVVFSAGWTPCIGPIYGSILNLAAQTGDVLQAAPLLAAYSLGLGIPFILAAVLLDRAQGILRRLQRHVRTVERIAGTLLVIVGFLVASGQLNILSQTLNGQFADFSARVEECGVGFFEGRITGSQLGDCLGGSLAPIRLEESYHVVLTPEKTQMRFVFQVEAAQAIDVELGSVETDLTPVAILQNAAGEEIARNSVLMLTTENKGLILRGQLLPAAGTYQLTILNATPTTKTDFRVKVREAEAVALPTTPDAANDSSANAEVGSAVTDLAAAAMNPTPTSLIPLLPANSIEGAAAASGAAIGVKVGNRAPDFTVTTDTGETVRLSDLRGKIVLLNFWGTWCGPCRREMPELQALYEAHSDENFTILALAVRDTLADVQQFRTEFGLTFPLALDENETVSTQYAIPGQPSTLVINSEGEIVFLSYSLVTLEQIEAVLTDLEA
jgi:cytochrome c-type biogenesis protein